MALSLSNSHLGPKKDTKVKEGALLSVDSMLLFALQVILEERATSRVSLCSKRFPFLFHCIVQAQFFNKCKIGSQVVVNWDINQAM
jgi:hypothetical protein